MDVINKLVSFMTGPWGVLILSVLLLISESLAEMPQFKSNSVIQAIKNGLKFLKDKLAPKAEQAPPQG